MGFNNAYTSTYDRYQSNLEKNLVLSELDRTILQKLNSEYDLFLLAIREQDQTKVLSIWVSMLNILSVPVDDPDRSLTYAQIRAQYSPQNLGPNDNPTFSGLTVTNSVACSQLNTNGITCNGEAAINDGLKFSTPTRMSSRNDNDILAECSELILKNTDTELEIRTTALDAFEFRIGQASYNFTADGSLVISDINGNFVPLAPEGLISAYIDINNWKIYNISNGLLIKIDSSADAFYFKNDGTLAMYDTSSSTEYPIQVLSEIVANDIKLGSNWIIDRTPVDDFLRLRRTDSNNSFVFSDDGGVYATMGTDRVPVRFDEGINVINMPIQGISNLEFYTGAILFQDGNDLKVNINGTIYTINKT